jgi:putative redox protein
MSQNPRRIGRLPLTVTLPASIPEEMRAQMEKIGHSCPVHASLHPDVEAVIEYHYA